jgi:hypothetical protein
MALLVGMNFVAIVLFGYGLAGLRWTDVFGSVVMNIIELVTMTAFHWWLIGRILRSDKDHQQGGSKAQRRIPLWLVYLIASSGLLVASGIVAT